MLRQDKSSVNVERWTALDGKLQLHESAVAVAKMSDRHCSQEWLRRPLFDAAREGRAGVVASLLSAGVSCSGSRDARGRTLIHAAALGGNLAVLLSLLDAGYEAEVDVQESQPPGRTPFLWAVWHGHGDMANELIAHGADASRADGMGQTALHLASTRGHTGIVSDLLQLGLDIEAGDDEGFTPLACAAAGGKADALRLLLRAGASTQTRTSTNRNSLEMALKANCTECVREMLAAGANPEAVDQVGLTALLAATRSGNIAAMATLIDGGADVEGRGGTVWTPLHFACHQGDVMAIETLVVRGGDLNARTSLKGSAPLHIAAGYANRRAVQELLLRWGADETALDARGQTASDVAGQLKYVFDRTSRHDEAAGSIRVMLANAPADRSWIRRRAVMMLVSRERTRLLQERMNSSSPQASGAKKRGSQGSESGKEPACGSQAGKDFDDHAAEGGIILSGMAAFRDVVMRLAGMDDESVFWSIMSFL